MWWYTVFLRTRKYIYLYTDIFKKVNAIYLELLSKFSM